MTLVFFKFQLAFFQQEIWYKYITRKNLTWAPSLVGSDNLAFFQWIKINQNLFVNFFSKFLKERFIFKKINRIKKVSDTVLVKLFIGFTCGKVLGHTTMHSSLWAHQVNLDTYGAETSFESAVAMYL